MCKRIERVVVALVLVLWMPVVLQAQEGQSDIESIMWEFVSTTDDLGQVETFIASFPNSQNIEEAQAIADNLRSRENAVNMEDTIFATVGSVSYSAPLAFGDSHIMGRTLSQIIQSSPAYPPIEGLPDAIWKDKTCASCHTWTRQDLCVQANTYVSMDPTKYREKKHPFGGLLKMNLRNWAQNGCD